jgi:iron complex outermembrane recepter protein
MLLLASPNIFAEDNVELDKIVVTASRMAQHDYKIASDVSVITAADIAASTAQTVNEVLEEQLGVQIYDSGTLKTSTIDIRGFGDTANRNVLVLVNDRKVNPMDISGPDLLQIPLESVERIEIIRGAGSVLYGDNAVGGVVNIITKEGKGDFSGQLGASGGSYDTSGTDLQLSGSKKGVSYYLFSKYYDYGGYRSNSDLLAKDYNSRLGYRLSDKLKVNLATFWHEDDYGLPGGLNDTELAQLGRRGSADENDFASSKDRCVQLTGDISPWPEDIKLGHLVLDASYRNRDTFAMFKSFGDYGTKSAIDTTGINGKYIFDEDLFGQEFNFVTGIDYYMAENDILGSGFNTDDITIAKDEFGVYTFSEYEAWDQVFVNAGTRFQKAYYTFDQRSGTPNYEKKDPDVSVSMFGSRYEYDRGSNIFFNVQQSFRFLATDEWYDTFSGLNTDLKQQEGIQYEVGVKHNIKDAVILSVTPYWLDLKNEIFFDPAAGDFGLGANNNYDKTRRVGVEVGQEFKVLRFWDTTLFSDFSVFVNYTYQNAEFNGGGQ